MRSTFTLVLAALALCGAGLWAAASCTSTRPASPATSAASAPDTRGEELARAREEITTLRSELAQAREEAAQPKGASEAASEAPATPAAAPVQVALKQAPHAPATIVSVRDDDPEYVAHMAKVERRFQTLGAMLKAQPRNEAWAKQHEDHFRALPASHEYFASTNVVELECRSTWCRVVTEHPDDNDQATYEEVVPNFSGGFAWSSMRSIPNTSPPRTEVFFAVEEAGPLPK